MNNLSGESRSRRHILSDWLALHELDLKTCRYILAAIAREASGEPAKLKPLNTAHHALDLEVAWLRTVAAMRDLFVNQQYIIDDTFEKTSRIVIDRPRKSRKAVTLDNGPTAYPTILFSYGGEPSDYLTIAHEFGHALQNRASRGKFVPPILREVCAFLGESALLAYTQRCNEARYAHLLQVWIDENARLFGALRGRLEADLLRPDTAYKYSWNYPIARYLAIQISERCPSDWTWSVFEGKASVQGVLQKLDLPARWNVNL